MNKILDVQSRVPPYSASRIYHAQRDLDYVKATGQWTGHAEAVLADARQQDADYDGRTLFISNGSDRVLMAVHKLTGQQIQLRIVGTRQPIFRFRRDGKQGHKGKSPWRIDNDQLVELLEDVRNGRFQVGKQ